MGREILYCATCQSQLRGSDFESGRAIRSENLAYCRACAPKEALPSAAARAEGPALTPESASSTGRLRLATGSTGARPGGLGPGTSRPRISVLWTAMGGLVVVILVLWLWMAGRANPPGIAGAPSPEPKPAPSESPAPPPRPAAAVPEETPPEEFARLFSRVDEALDREDLRGAAFLLSQALLERSSPARRTAIEEKSKAVTLATARIYEARKKEALEARRRGDGAAVEAIRARISSWGDDALVRDFERVLDAAPPPPAPESSSAKVPSPTPAPPPDTDRLRALWQRAADRAALREYGLAVEEVEKAIPTFSDEHSRKGAGEDLDLLKQVRSIVESAKRVLAAHRKGDKIALRIWDSEGVPRREEGAFVRFEGGVVELTRPKGEAVFLPLGEILPSSLVEEIAAADPKQPALGGPGPSTFCLLEGDLEGAQALGRTGFAAAPGTVGSFAVSASQRLRGGRLDRKLRAIAFDAEQALATPSAAAPAVRRFSAILSGDPEAAFVRRNGEWLAARSQGAREFLLPSAEGHSFGLMAPGHRLKGEFCWTNSADDAADRVRQSGVEFTFWPLSDVDYRSWAYVGGCCQEVFSFFVQGSDLRSGSGAEAKSYEPGGEAALAAKLSSVFGLPKSHAAHTGPKHPERWAWIPVPLPRYSTSGPKRLRLLSAQKGFSVAAVFVTAVRSSPPSEAELREAPEKPKPGSPKAGLIGWWKLDEESGGVAFDSTRSQKDAFLGQGISWTAGPERGGLAFGGSGGSLEVSNATYCATSDTFTMAFWARPQAERQSTPEATSGTEGTRGQRYVIFPNHGGNIGPGHVGAGVSVGTNGIAVFEHGPSYLPSVLAYDVPLRDWTHVAVVYERRQPKLYVNGSLARTGLAGNWIVHPSPISGGTPYGYYQGDLRDVRLYDRALPAQEVATLSRQGTLEDGTPK